MVSNRRFLTANWHYHFGYLNGGDVWLRLHQYHKERVQKRDCIGAISVSIDRNAWAVFVFKEIWANDASTPQVAPNSYSALTSVRLRMGISAILLINLPTKIKINFIRKDGFFWKIFVQFLIGPINPNVAQT